MLIDKSLAEKIIDYCLSKHINIGVVHPLGNFTRDDNEFVIHFDGEYESHQLRIYNTYIVRNNTDLEESSTAITDLLAEVHQWSEVSDF